jgi:hypothetical protein
MYPEVVTLHESCQGGEEQGGESCRAFQPVPPEGHAQHQRQ